MWIRLSSDSGASIFSMRSICLSLLCACDALLALARKRSANSWSFWISRLLVFVRGEMLLRARLALLDVGVVVAAIAVNLLVANLENIVDERIQKRAVVRDHQDRAGIILEIILEPAERFEIEMIRRLVEHEQVGLHHQQPREMRAHDPAAAHRLRAGG